MEPKEKSKTAIVLSGGGSRGAYQVGALKAHIELGVIVDEDVSVIAGTSIGAVNAIVLAAGMRSSLSQSIESLEIIWKRRTYRNTFAGHMSKAFMRAVRVAMLRYTSPGPIASSISIFDPTPLREEVDAAVFEFGGLRKGDLAKNLEAVAVMATVEGAQRRPLLLATLQRPLPLEAFQCSTFEHIFIDELLAAHGFASAALPSVLPAVDLNLDLGEVRLIDGGICDNVPVGPAVRLGADRVVLFDSSGRRWWFDHYDEPHDTKPSWEVEAPHGSYALLPREMIQSVNTVGLGPLLKAAVGKSRSDFIQALGPTWPIFKILKHKMGEDLAYEVLSYTALHQDYLTALIEQGYNDSKEKILAERKKAEEKKLEEENKK